MALVVDEMKVGDMRVQFVAQETAREQDKSFQRDASGEPKGTGVYINIEVDTIDEYYEQLKDDGIIPSTEPKTGRGDSGSLLS